MADFRIINPGLLTTVQDAGRSGFQQYGMPVSGAMDWISFRLANILVGNPTNEACLETTFMGPEIEFLESSEFAVTGAEIRITLNGEPIASNQNHIAHKGDILKLETAKNGFRNYIAFSGGIEVASIMGSKSTYMRGKLGGYKGRALQSNDELNCGIKPSSFKHRKVTNALFQLPKAHNTIRVIPANEVNAFTFEGLQTFLDEVYTISPQSDRMGYRLNGKKIAHKEGADILSSGIANGTIQVPSHGEPIIMLADRQTVGGYTKIANVISADLPLLGQMKPGDKIRFKEVNVYTAQQAYKDIIKELKSISF